MATVKGGVSLALMETGVGASVPAHMTAKPTPYGSLGHYVITGVTGAIGAGAGADSEVFQFRWTHASNVAIVTSIYITGMRATTAFAVGTIDIKATIARAFTAAGTGGTAQTLTTNNQKMRTSMGTTTVGEIRVATTAALGAGTKTLDAQNVGQLLGHSSGGFGSATPIIGSIYVPRDGQLFRARVEAGEHGIALVTNEGFVVRATVPATGVWNLGVQVHWAEATLY